MNCTAHARGGLGRGNAAARDAPGYRVLGKFQKKLVRVFPGSTCFFPLVHLLVLMVFHLFFFYFCISILYIFCLIFY
jgi:hypothetical protein